MPVVNYLLFNSGDYLGRIFAGLFEKVFLCLIQNKYQCLKTLPLQLSATRQTIRRCIPHNRPDSLHSITRTMQHKTTTLITGVIPLRQYIYSADVGSGSLKRLFGQHRHDLCTEVRISSLYKTFLIFQKNKLQKFISESSENTKRRWPHQSWPPFSELDSLADR